MRAEDFDFDLPESRVALRPARPRDSARLLVVGAPDTPPLQDRSVRDLPEFLRPGDVLVVNDTRVLPARLLAVRSREGQEAQARIEITLTHREKPECWRAFARPAKRLKTGDVLDCSADLCAEVIERGEGGEVLLAFDKAGDALDAALERAGSMPLPPYIASRRAPDEADRSDYQTAYASHRGSVAAPTAGLHFTERLLAEIARRGVTTVPVTLHIGPGTFLPVKAEDVRNHRMHAEWGEVGANAADAINAARASGGRAVAVGTTALRLIESAAAPDGTVRPFRGETDLFILPGYRLRIADMLMTNFHLPRSTLFMLVCAFAGTERMRAAYAHAVAHRYRFYSYGDASLLFRQES